MNVAWIAPLLTVLFLSELLVTSTDAIFFPSLLPSSKVKTHFPTSVKLDDKDAEFKNRQHPQSKQKPHIIIILADDMGWNDVSFHGSDQIPTPNIDALAYNGIILNNHYVPALCTPSRTALMTGKNPIHLGMQHSVILPAEPRGLPFTEKLLPEYLKELGYKTHAVGKWHLGFYKKRYTPTFRGFDSHFGYWNGLQDYFTHITQDPDPQFSNFKGFDMRRNLTVAWETEGKYSTDLFTDEAVRLINEHNKDQPMFLYLAHLAPHKGNQKQLFRAPDEDIAKFSYIIDPERRIQAAVISKLDEGVGAVMDALRHRGMLENSIVLFMSDNGAPTIGILSNQGSNYPLRGIKDSPWEGGTRGVAAIWSPLIKKSKRVSNQMMFMADWLPTLLSAAENVDWASVVLALRDEEGVVPSPPFITFTNVTFAVVKCCPPPVDIGESRGTKKLEEVSYSKLNHSTDPSIRRAKTKYRTSLKRLNTLIATLQLLKLSVGVERERLGNIDGFDLWRTLTADKISPRSDIVINIDDISNYAAIRRGDFKYIIGETDTGSAWVGATGNSSEGISPKYDPYKVLYSKAGAAISGVITARQAMELNEKRKNEENVNGDPLIKDFHEKILTANEILELRNKAQIQCNVKEENKIPCDPRKAPCLFNIEKDPCEMVNLANSRPVILAILEKILTKYRLTTVPPSNVNEDPKANPALWNNTWVSWDDPHPFALAQTNNELQPRSAPAIAVVSIICGLFVVGVMTLLALKCRKSNSNSLEDFDEDSIAMARIAENEKRDDTLKDEDLTSKPL